MAKRRVVPGSRLMQRRQTGSRIFANSWRLISHGRKRLPSSRASRLMPRLQAQPPNASRIIARPLEVRSVRSGHLSFVICHLSF